MADDNGNSSRGGGSSVWRGIKTFLKIILGILIFIVVMAAGIGIGFVTANMNARPDIAGEIVPQASSQIYDSAGNEIANIHAAENRMPVKIEQIPTALQRAFIAIEDNRFYEHNGIDPRGLARAVYSNISKHEIAEGGSTITQQLAKNAYLTQERTIKRKIQEVFLALQLEKQYTKQEILEFYLNQIYFGRGAYGVQAAAKTYFNKNVEDLNLSECALLAGIPKSPNYYSPFNDMQAAIERRNLVLDQMVKYHYITRDAATEAKNTEIVLAQPDRPEEQKDAEYFISYVTQQMIEKFGEDAVYKEGLKIYTTIDLEMQRMAEQAIADNLPTDYTDANGIQQPQCAIVAIEPTTGYVRVMVGGRGTDQFNRAAQAERQPGSSFKPFVFAAALENGFTPDTMINDSPININGWQPQNSSMRFSGNVSMRTVATFSMNVPTVKIAQKIGVDNIIYYAQQMGITTFVMDGDTNDRNLATSLGGLTRGVTPLEIASAYCTFANGGIHIPHTSVTKVLDRKGSVIFEAVPEGVAVITPESAAALTSMLQDVISKGSGRAAAIGRPAAGKTGTTTDYKDAWFVGYTPDLVAAVWVGNDDSTTTNGIMGGMTPATTWGDFMSRALANTPAHDFSEIVVERRPVVRPPQPELIQEPDPVAEPAPPPRRSYEDESYQPEPRYRSDYYEEPEPEPSYSEPAYEEPRYDEPSYSEPTYDEPRYDEPSYSDQNYYDEPRYDEPRYNDQNYYDEPSYIEPRYEEPSYNDQNYYDEPRYEEPSYDEPSYNDSYDDSYYDDAPSPGDDLAKGV